MTTIARVVASVLVALALVAGAAGITLAASPSPTVGGVLSAVGNTITVKSNGTVPARITMSAEAVTLSESAFLLEPGASHSLTFTGAAQGHVYAAFAVVMLAGGEANSVTLGVTLKPYSPPFDPSPYVPWVLVVVAVGFVAARLRIWRWRIHIARAA